MIDLGLCFANLGDLRLVRGRLGGFIHSLLPFGRAGVFVLDIRDLFFVCGIDGLLRFDAKDFGFRGCVILDRSFQFHPVDPDGGWRSVTVLLLVAVELLSEKFSRLGLAFLDANPARGACAELDSDLNDLRVLYGAGYRLRAEQFGEAG